MTATPSARRLAIFDLDGTLLDGDSLLVFVRFALGRAPRAWSRLPGFVLRAAGLAVGRERRTRFKEACLGVIDPLSAGEQEALVGAFLEHLLARRLRPPVARRVAVHAAAGDVPVLLSASPDVYVVPLGARLGFATVLCTELVARPDGGKTSRIAGRNCRGAAKVETLLRHFGLDGIDWQGSYAYADAWSDMSLLERVGHPRPVRPSRRLRAEAVARQWEVIDCGR